MITLRQFDGGSLVLDQVPQRVVSLVPSITENLILFGLHPAGRTSFCIEPGKDVAAIPVVGGTKTPKLSGIVKLSPDLVIANKEENRKEDIAALEKEGLNVWVTYPVTLKESIVLMEEIAKICGDKSKAIQILSSCRNTLQETANLRGANSKRALALIWKEPWMAVGDETYAHDMIRVAGGINVGALKEGRYPKMTQSEILEARPEVLLLPSEPYAFERKDQAYWTTECSRTGLNTRVELISGEDFSWFGPRLVSGLHRLREVFSDP